MIAAAGNVLTWVEPNVLVLPDGRVRFGIDSSHGVYSTMTLQPEYVDSVDWEVNHDTNGPHTVQVVCNIELINGQVLRIGQETLTGPPFCRPVLSGKGRGKGRC